MVVRLLILIPFTLFVAVMSIIWVNIGNEIPWAFGGLTLIGLYGIVRVIADHHRFKLVGHILVIESPLKRARTIDLNTMLQWLELGFNIRGQRRKTVVLFLGNDEKVVVDNSEYAKEFEELLRYLAQSHHERKTEV